MINVLYFWERKNLFFIYYFHVVVNEYMAALAVYNIYIYYRTAQGNKRAWRESYCVRFFYIFQHFPTHSLSSERIISLLIHFKLLFMLFSRNALLWVHCLSGKGRVEPFPMFWHLLFILWLNFRKKINKNNYNKNVISEQHVNKETKNNYTIHTYSYM